MINWSSWTFNKSLTIRRFQDVTLKRFCNCVAYTGLWPTLLSWVNQRLHRTGARKSCDETWEKFESSPLLPYVSNSSQQNPYHRILGYNRSLPKWWLVRFFNLALTCQLAWYDNMLKSEEAKMKGDCNGWWASDMAMTRLAARVTDPPSGPPGSAHQGCSARLM